MLDRREDRRADPGPNAAHPGSLAVNQLRFAPCTAAVWPAFRRHLEDSTRDSGAGDPVTPAAIALWKRVDHFRALARRGSAPAYAADLLGYEACLAASAVDGRLRTLSSIFDLPRIHRLLGNGVLPLPEPPPVGLRVFAFTREGVRVPAPSN